MLLVILLYFGENTVDLLFWFKTQDCVKRDLVTLGSRIIKGNGEGVEREMEGSGRGGE